MNKIVREFSPAGPCLTRGQLVKETPRFYVYREDYADRAVRKIAKRTPEHYSRAHIEPCPSCRDHPRTQYPEGYMD